MAQITYAASPAEIPGVPKKSLNTGMVSLWRISRVGKAVGRVKVVADVAPPVVVAPDMVPVVVVPVKALGTCTADPRLPTETIERDRRSWGERKKRRRKEEQVIAWERETMG